MERLMLSSGRVLILTGVVLITTTVGKPGVDSKRAFLCFLLFIAGVSLVMLSPVAGRAGTGTVMNYFGAHNGGLDLQKLFLDAGRASVLGGYLVLTYSFGDPAANTVLVYLGFSLLLIGVFLLTFSPVAFRFLGAPLARIGVALNHLLAPGN